MRKRVFWLFALLSLTVLYSAQAQVRPVLYRNARIWTGNTAQPYADAMLVRQGSIVAIGKEADLRRKLPPKTTTTDLNRKLVVPGFTDSHTHFMSGGFQLASVDLRDADTPKEFIRRLAAFAQTLPKGRWITGGDWDHERWGGDLPDRAWIDSVTVGYPVFVNRLDGHMALANSEAMRLAGFTRNSAEIPGGTIVRRPDGEPTGLLKDEAMNPIFRAIPDPSSEESDEAFLRAQEFAARLGVTQVHDMGQWDHLETYRRARQKGTLHMRIYSFVPLATWDRLARYVQKNGRGDQWLHWGGLKGFVDGSLGSTTAWFFEPYKDDPTTRGLITTDTLSLAQWITQADRARLQVVVHAIGDRANQWLLNAYQEAVRQNGARDRRFRIEHAQHLSPELVQRMSREGVIASMQPYHAIDDGRWAEKRIGNRIGHMYMFRDMLRENVHLAFGSDWTVAPLNPLEGIYAAVTRRTLDDLHPGGWVPEQKISVEDALRAYTAGCAYAGFSEQKSGQLKPGNWADFVVLSENILEIEPKRIRDVKVIQTVIGGKTVFKMTP